MCGYPFARRKVVGVLIRAKDADLALVVTIANASDLAMTNQTAPRGVEVCITNGYGRRTNITYDLS